MWTNHRQASTRGVTSSITDRRRVGLLALGLAVSWASMVFHNQWELPLTLLDLENTGPLAADIALLIACWRWPRSRLTWTVILVWGWLNMVVGGIVTVLPLPVLPFFPEQTVDHYAVHVVYAIGQLPLVLLAGGALRQLRHQKKRIGAEEGQDGRANG
jgi:hypothetical protein